MKWVSETVHPKFVCVGARRLQISVVADLNIDILFIRYFPKGKCEIKEKVRQETNIDLGNYSKHSI